MANRPFWSVTPGSKYQSLQSYKQEGRYPMETIPIILILIGVSILGGILFYFRDKINENQINKYLKSKFFESDYATKDHVKQKVKTSTRNSAYTPTVERDLETTEIDTNIDKLKSDIIIDVKPDLPKERVKTDSSEATAARDLGTTGIDTNIDKPKSDIIIDVKPDQTDGFVISSNLQVAKESSRIKSLPPNTPTEFIKLAARNRAFYEGILTLQKLNLDDDLLFEAMEDLWKKYNGKSGNQRS